MTIADFDNANFAYNYVLNEHNYMSKQMKDVLEKYDVLSQYYENLYKELKEFFDFRLEAAC
jgi:hypothetical protein